MIDVNLFSSIAFLVAFMVIGLMLIALGINKNKFLRFLGGVLFLVILFIGASSW